MDKFKSYYPDKFQFLPKSYKLPEDNDIMITLLRNNKQKIYIAKPSIGN